jgi:hypothetical protein
MINNKGNELPTVDLIASGYEWICPDPDCETFNETIQVEETVTCKNCRMTYQVGEVLHAEQ